MSFTRSIRTFAIAVPFVLLAACGQPDAAGTDATAKGGDETATAAAKPAEALSPAKQAFVTELVNACTTSAVRSGAPAAAATAICQCTADELANTKDESELLTMKPEDSLPIMKVCAQKHGITPS